MRLIVNTAGRFVSVDGLTLHFDFPADTDPRLMQIEWDGSVGSIHRRSVAPGRVDFAYFVEGGFEAVLGPYLALWNAEKARRDAEDEAKAQVVAQEAAARAEQHAAASAAADAEAAAAETTS